MAQPNKTKDLLTIRADRDNYYFGAVLRPTGKTISKGGLVAATSCTHTVHTHVYIYIYTYNIILCTVYIYIYIYTREKLTGLVVYLIVCFE